MPSSAKRYTSSVSVTGSSYAHIAVTCDACAKLSTSRNAFHIVRYARRARSACRSVMLPPPTRAPSSGNAPRSGRGTPTTACQRRVTSRTYTPASYCCSLISLLSRMRPRYVAARASRRSSGARTARRCGMACAIATTSSTRSTTFLRALRGRPRRSIRRMAQLTFLVDVQEPLRLDLDHIAQLSGFRRAEHAHLTNDYIVTDPLLDTVANHEPSSCDCRVGRNLRRESRCITILARLHCLLQPRNRNAPLPPDTIRTRHLSVAQQSIRCVTRDAETLRRLRRCDPILVFRHDITRHQIAE